MRIAVATKERDVLDQRGIAQDVTLKALSRTSTSLEQDFILDLHYRTAVVVDREQKCSHSCHS